MRPRIQLAKFFLRAGEALKTLSLMVMRPADLMEFSRLLYSRPDIVHYFSNQDFVASSIPENEKKILEALHIRSGKLLLLGLGGGRDALFLARHGFTVTGIDNIPEMVRRAENLFLKNGLTLDGRVQHADNLDIPDNTYDIAWLSCGMYSVFPTHALRIKILQRIGRALTRDGCCVCGFLFNEKLKPLSRKGHILRKIFAFLTGGYGDFEPGDCLRLNQEFAHFFSSEAEIVKEFQEAGFDVLTIIKRPQAEFASALLKKRNPTV